MSFNDSSIFFISDQPEIDESPRYQKAAAEPGGTATLICRASAAPEPSFTWLTHEETPIETDILPTFENRYKFEHKGVS